MCGKRFSGTTSGRGRVCSLVVLGAAIAALAPCQPALAAAGGDAPSSDAANSQVWQPQIRSVAVFKNGLGFFLSDGEASLQQGWCLAKDVPPAVFGTLAIFAEDEAQVVDMVGAGPGTVVEFDGRDAPADPAEKVARLEAAKHLTLELCFTHNDQENSATGKLVSV